MQNWILASRTESEAAQLPAKVQIIWLLLALIQQFLRFCFSGWEKGKAPSSVASPVTVSLCLSAVGILTNKFSRDLKCVLVSLSSKSTVSGGWVGGWGWGSSGGWGLFAACFPCCGGFFSSGSEAVSPLFFNLCLFVCPRLRLRPRRLPLMSLCSLFRLSAGSQRPARAQPGQASARDAGAHRAGELPSVPAEGGGAGGGARGDAGGAQPQQRAGQGHGRRPGLQVRPCHGGMGGLVFIC